MKNYIFLICFVCTMACKSEPKIDRDLLAGDWIVSNAMKNGVKTNNLEGLVFSFSDDLLTTNFTGDVIEQKYSLTDMKISTSDDGVVYKVISLDSTHLVMETHVKDTDFTFTFIRVSG